MNDLIIFMSLSGSIPLIFYFGVRLLFKEQCETRKLITKKP